MWLLPVLITVSAALASEPASRTFYVARLIFGLEREAKRLEQRAAFVVGLGSGHDGDVHAANAVNGILVDLVEHNLLGQTEGVVAVAVELLAAEAPEVADTRQCQRDQTVQEFPHAVATQSCVRTDRHAFAQLELCDRLAGLGYLRLLAGDQGQIADSAVDQLGVLSGISNTHVHNDLHQTGNLVDVLVLEFLNERALDGIRVLGLQTRNDLACRSLESLSH